MPEKDSLESTHYDATSEEPSYSSSSSGGNRRLLRRSKQDRVIGGVCGGLGHYLDIDPVLLRIAFLVLLIPGGLGLLLYIISWIAIPEFKTTQEELWDSHAALPINRQLAGTIVGGLLILIGLLILLERLIDWFDPRIIGGTVLILIGAFVVWRGMKRGDSQ
jgi:phage shock protein C